VSLTNLVKAIEDNYLNKSWFDLWLSFTAFAFRNYNQMSEALVKMRTFAYHDLIGRHDDILIPSV
jgi:hypothetical protein